MITRDAALPIAQQCNVLALALSTAYYQPKPTSEADLALMRRIDQMHLEYPFLGSRQIKKILVNEGIRVGRKRVARLMAQMGIQALYQRPKTTRRILSWRLSNTMTTDFCIQAVEDAIARYGKPEIFNTDQGSQFTSVEFTGLLKDNGIQISMDGNGASRDNGFVERFWRSVKYEEVYLHADESVSQARSGIDRYIRFYNARRPHTALDGKAPDTVYFNSRPATLAA